MAGARVRKVMGRGMMALEERGEDMMGDWWMLRLCMDGGLGFRGLTTDGRAS